MVFLDGYLEKMWVTWMPLRYLYVILWMLILPMPALATSFIPDFFRAILYGSFIAAIYTLDELPDELSCEHPFRMLILSIIVVPIAILLLTFALLMGLLFFVVMICQYLVVTLVKLVFYYPLVLGIIIRISCKMCGKCLCAARKKKRGRAAQSKKR